MEAHSLKSVTKPEVLLGKIHAEFPDLTWQTYTSITQGWDHEVIILDGAIVFRFPNDVEYAAKLATEIHVLRQLRPLASTNIPDYLYIAKDNSFAGYPIIPGKTLTKAALKSLGTTTIQSIAKQMADLLSLIHAAKGKGIDLTGVDLSYMPSEQAEVKKLAAKYLPSVLNQEDYRIVEAILHDVDDLLAQPAPSTFIHGDLYSNHLLWDDTNQKLGLIDFSDMSIADPAIDFAELYEYGRAFVETVFRYYAGEKDASFLDRAWVYQCWTGVYMMTDHFVYRKTTFDEARRTFDRIKAGR